MTVRHCLLSSQCKKAGDVALCYGHCFAYLKLHGESGTGGLWRHTAIPVAYAQVTATNLPYAKDNPEAYAVVTEYCRNVLQQVKEGIGLYLYSIPNAINPKGTGTGKTTSAVAILHEYLVARTIQHVKRTAWIDQLPALFVNASKFQNQFNAQFRGPREMQEKAAVAFYHSKCDMLQAELLVLDDVGVREATEAYKNEFYEVIDERCSDRKTTIFTSNEPLEQLSRRLDPRISSRIGGMTIPVSFEGEDQRSRAMLG
ncbi:DNA replication protein [Heliobacillus mobilis]|uniref:DNA replication protein n=1 Tax=Heliobacterium mobile TaxID=28064 RepID=A0A6I3SNZ8_HELMO|nr:ATP-binding protein [Heliobacterium mobile]MTV50770.1 DNA replication protein [Heliobacterium mobile]